MKNLLKTLNQTGDCANICETLSRIDTNENKNELTKELTEKLKTHGDDTILIRVFPCIAQLALQKIDTQFLMYATFIKHQISYCDLHKVRDEDLIAYVDALSALSNTFSSNVTLESYEKAGLTPTDAFYTAHCAHILRTFTPDALAFYEYVTFEQAFHVKCPHCGNDLHSLALGESKIEPLQNLSLSPATDSILWRLKAMETLEFNREFHILWHLYGSNSCTVCGKERVPVMSAGQYRFDQNVSWKLDEELLLHLREILLDQVDFDMPNWADKLVFRTMYLSQLYRWHYGEDDIRYYEFMLKNAVTVHTFYGSDYANYLVGCAQKAIEGYQGDPLILADVYFAMGHAKGYYYNAGQDAKRQAVDYFEKAEQIFIERLSIKHIKVSATRRRKHIALTQLAEENRTLIEEDIARMRQSAHYSEEEVQAFIDEVDAEESVENEITAQLEEIEELSAEYGSESDIVADYRQELAALYVKAGQTELARENFEKAVEIHIRELGKEYMIPDFLRNLVYAGKKFIKVERPSAELATRARSVADALSDMANFHYTQEEYKKALIAHQKGLNLWLWLTFEDCVEVALKYHDIAKTYLALGQRDKALEFSEKSVGLYVHCINNSTYESERDQAREEIDEARAFLAELS